MGPSLRDYSSLRPGTRDRPSTRDAQPVAEHSLVIPSRTSSLHSRITQPIPSTLNIKPAQRTPKTLTHAYMVCGVGREPAQWVRAPPPVQGKIGHMKGAVGQFWLPEILGSSPRLEQDNEIARVLHSAMRACFPHDVEICTGRSQPHCVHHSFVLQQDSSHTLYGIALRVWSRADEKRAETIRDLRRRTEADYFDGGAGAAEEAYWIPYCLSFLSRYPLYDLLGDYLRGMWIHWNKATNLFHAEEVSRILSFPAPRLNDLVRIDMKDYALCYQFPSSPTGFQNFALWPLFSCLSLPNVVGVVEAAVSPTRRIVFVSHYPAMLTVAAEAVRYCVRVYEWSGLYVPVVHARHVTELVQEPGPYILGVTAECKSLFTAPPDALVVDLDRNFVLTSAPPSRLTAAQRAKMINRLAQALNGDVATAGVPSHLRQAYGGGKLVPAGQIIVMRGEVENIQDPDWWNQDNVMTVMDHVCEKLGRNTGMKALFGGATKKPLMTKVSMRHLNEIVRERNQYSRDTYEAWQDYINLKGRLDVELSKVNKRNNFLVEELESWKQQFLKFQAFAEQLTKETQDLKVKIETHKREARRLTTLLDQHKDDAARLTARLAGTEKQRDDALEALVLQQEIAEELERERQKNKKALHRLTQAHRGALRQREEAQRVVVHLRSLIDGQSHHMEHIVRSLHDAPELAELAHGGSPDETAGESGADDGDDGRRSVASERSAGGAAPSAPASNRSSLNRLSSRSLISLRRRSGRQAGAHASSAYGGGRPFSPAGSSVDSATAADKVNPEMESRFFHGGTAASSARGSARLSEASLVDLADRHLRDKTEAIASIIRSISDQCAAAVEGLQLAHGAEDDLAEDARALAAVGAAEPKKQASQDMRAKTSAGPVRDGGVVATQTPTTAGPEDDASDASGAFDDAPTSPTGDAADLPRGTTPTPASTAAAAAASSSQASSHRASNGSTLPPTPDLYRSSTALSINSVSTGAPGGGAAGAGGERRASGPFLAATTPTKGAGEGGAAPGIVGGDGEGSERGSILHERAERSRLAQGGKGEGVAELGAAPAAQDVA